MVNVGRVVRSKRLGCQRITVKRYAASWQDGAYTRDEDKAIVLQVAAIVTVAHIKDSNSAIFLTNAITVQSCPDRAVKSIINIRRNSEDFVACSAPFQLIADSFTIGRVQLHVRQKLHCPGNAVTFGQ